MRDELINLVRRSTRVDHLRDGAADLGRDGLRGREIWLEGQFSFRQLLPQVVDLPVLIVLPLLTARRDVLVTHTSTSHGAAPLIAVARSNPRDR